MSNKKMRFFSKIDIISPSITLYYKEELLHSSIFSVILSLICYILMVGCGSYYLLQFFRRKNLTAFFFNRYVENAGNFPVNSSSLFSFFQLVRDDVVLDIDFDSLRFIGLDVTIDTYVSDSDLTNYNHWIYGKCNNDSDTQGIGYLINSVDYFKSACIRKYYNKTTGKYYENNDVNFRWPSLDRGCSNEGATYYGIIVEKCRNDSLRTDLEKRFCKSNSEISKYMTNIGIQVNITNNIIDVLNYKEPFIQFFESIVNPVYNDNYIVNHLNFNPATIKTRKGIFFEEIEEKHIYLYDRNEIVTRSTGNTGIYMSVYFWMQNSMHYYERKYQLLQDALSNIGGITRIILIVAKTINFFVSEYVTSVDSEELFIIQNGNSFMEGMKNKNIVEKKIKKDIDNSNFPVRKMFYNNYLYQNNNAFFDGNCISPKNSNHCESSKKDIDISHKTDNLEKDKNKGSNKYLFTNKNINLEEEENNNYNDEQKERNNTNKDVQTNLHNKIKSSI